MRIAYFNHDPDERWLHAFLGQFSFLSIIYKSAFGAATLSLLRYHTALLFDTRKDTFPYGNRVKSISLSRPNLTESRKHKMCFSRYHDTWCVMWPPWWLVFRCVGTELYNDPESLVWSPLPIPFKVCNFGQLRARCDQEGSDYMSSIIQTGEKMQTFELHYRQD